MGSIVPISFEACIIETKIVSGYPLGLIAFSTSFGFTIPYLSTFNFVILNPCFSSHFADSIIQGCSIEEIIIWFFPSLPFGKLRAQPLRAVLLLSVAEEVKIISLASAPIILAIFSLLSSKAIFDFWPKECKDIVLPNSFEKYGAIAFKTLLSIGVVAA